MLNKSVCRIKFYSGGYSFPFQQMTFKLLKSCETKFSVPHSIVKSLLYTKLDNPISDSCHLCAICKRVRKIRRRRINVNCNSLTSFHMNTLETKKSLQWYTI